MSRAPGVEPGPSSRVRGTHTNRFAILTVCTANICRSPLMELLLRQQLDTSFYEVGSAGTRGFKSHPMDSGAARQAIRFGAAPHHFKSRPVTADMIRVSGLILTATREHRSSVLGLDPMALRRTFTLLEFAQLAAEYSNQPLDALIVESSRHRSHAKGEIDIEDPFRQGELVNQQVAEKILGAVREVSSVLNAVAARGGIITS
ncbi:MAG: arsenate reductase/protein-tyrosine-phosphatase family protein [Aeromicrobium sp.]